MSKELMHNIEIKKHTLLIEKTHTHTIKVCVYISGKCP